LDLTGRHVGNPADLRFLDLGCGVGLTDAFLVNRVKSVNGVDVAEGVLAKARDRLPAVDYTCYDGRQMPFADNAFDVSFAMCVFHHIVPQNRSSVVREMVRVTRPGGIVVVFEHNPLNPFTQLAVRRCSLDADAVLLSRGETLRLLHAGGLDIVDSRFILLTPWDFALLGILERLFNSLPLGAQYFVAGRVL